MPFSSSSSSPTTRLTTFQRSSVAASEIPPLTPNTSSPNRLRGGWLRTIEATAPSRSTRTAGRSRSATANPAGDALDLGGLGAARDPWELQRVVVVAGDDVDVEVEDRLPGGGPA